MLPRRRRRSKCLTLPSRPFIFSEHSLMLMLCIMSVLFVTCLGEWANGSNKCPQHHPIPSIIGEEILHDGCLLKCIVSNGQTERGNHVNESTFFYDINDGLQCDVDKLCHHGSCIQNSLQHVLQRLETLERKTAACETSQQEERLYRSLREVKMKASLAELSDAINNLRQSIDSKVSYEDIKRLNGTLQEIAKSMSALANQPSLTVSDMQRAPPAPAPPAQSEWGVAEIEIDGDFVKLFSRRLYFGGQVRQIKGPDRFQYSPAHIRDIILMTSWNFDDGYLDMATIEAPLTIERMLKEGYNGEWYEWTGKMRLKLTWKPAEEPLAH